MYEGTSLVVDEDREVVALPLWVVRKLFHNVDTEYKRKSHDYEFHPSPETLLVIKMLKDTLATCERWSEKYYSGRFCFACGEELVTEMVKEDRET